MPRNALGRGLSALIREPEPQPPPQQQLPQPSAREQPQRCTGERGRAAAATAGSWLAPTPELMGLFQVDIDLIDPSPYQPRTRSAKKRSKSSRARSVPAASFSRWSSGESASRFQLIAGERRWRAAQRAELSRVPVVVRDVPEEMALEMTLVENLQREDLNPIEQARAFQRLTEEFHLTQEQVAERTGKDRATIANAVRLLKLEEPIQDLLEEGRLTAGHGRAFSPSRIAGRASNLPAASREGE